MVFVSSWVEIGQFIGTDFGKVDVRIVKLQE